MIRSGKLRILGRHRESGKAASIFGGSENSKSLEEKFDSGLLSLHVLSIP